MRMLSKLERLDSYLKYLTAAGARISCIINQEDATSRLASAYGMQVLLARPEMKESLDDLLTPKTTVISTVIFVLEKDLGAGRTDETVTAQYDRTLAVADTILSNMCDDLEACELGLRLTDFNVVPEVSLFGGWNGYSISLSFK